MKAIKNSLGLLMLAIIILTTSVDVLSQGRGNGNGRGNNHPGRGKYDERNRGKGHDHNSGWNNNYERYDHDRERMRHSDWDHRNYLRNDHHHFVTYRHHRYHHPSWAPVYGSRYNTRYIYYQDYNVYYDCHRDVFMTWNGRRWIVSAHIPDFMLRVDFRSARVYGVNYWDDDFEFYLQRRRPSYIGISAGW